MQSTTHSDNEETQHHNEILDREAEKAIYIKRRIDEDIPEDDKVVVAYLHVLPEASINEELVFPIYTGINIIGRGGDIDCDVIIPVVGVSSVHALIEVSPDSVEHFVEDLASTNGTVYGQHGYRLATFRLYQLTHNKLVSFGPAKCRYEITNPFREGLGDSSDSVNPGNRHIEMSPVVPSGANSVTPTQMLSLNVPPTQYVSSIVPPTQDMLDETSPVADSPLDEELDSKHGVLPRRRLFLDPDLLMNKSAKQPSLAMKRDVGNESDTTEDAEERPTAESISLTSQAGTRKPMEAANVGDVDDQLTESQPSPQLLEKLEHIGDDGALNRDNAALESNARPNKSDPMDLQIPGLFAPLQPQNGSTKVDALSRMKIDDDDETDMEDVNDVLENSPERMAQDEKRVEPVIAVFHGGDAPDRMEIDRETHMNVIPDPQHPPAIRDFQGTCETASKSSNPSSGLSKRMANTRQSPGKNDMGEIIEATPESLKLYTEPGKARRSSVGNAPTRAATADVSTPTKTSFELSPRIAHDMSMSAVVLSAESASQLGVAQKLDTLRKPSARPKRKDAAREMDDLHHSDGSKQISKRVKVEDTLRSSKEEPAVASSVTSRRSGRRGSRKSSTHQAVGVDEEDNAESMAGNQTFGSHKLKAKRTIKRDASESIKSSDIAADSPQRATSAALLMASEANVEELPKGKPQRKRPASKKTQSNEATPLHSTTAERSEPTPSPSKSKDKIMADNPHSVPFAVEYPKVMFTGLSDNEEKAKLVKNLGGVAVDNWRDCTHLVTDRIRRTMKFLCALSAGKYILSVKWLDASKKEGRFVDEAKHLLKDTKTEKQYAFKLKDSLARTQKGACPRLFSGLKVYATPSVKPATDELREILDAAGAELLTTTPATGPADDTIIIGNPDDAGEVKHFMGEGWKVYSIEFILTGLLQMKVDHESHLLLLDDTSAVPASGKKKRR